MGNESEEGERANQKSELPSQWREGDEDYFLLVLKGVCTDLLQLSFWKGSP